MRWNRSIKKRAHQTSYRQCGRHSTVAAPSAATAQNYVVAANDVLDVYIIDVPELSRSYRVEPDGKLKFPFLKALPAAGMTLEQLSAALAKGLKEAGAVSRPF